MEQDHLDKTGLIREAYLIEGIGLAECRSIFLDWVMKLPPELPPAEAIGAMVKRYKDRPAEHPMSRILEEGLGITTAGGRRGGHRARKRD